MRLATSPEHPPSTQTCPGGGVCAPLPALRAHGPAESDSPLPLGLARGCAGAFIYGQGALGGGTPCLHPPSWAPAETEPFPQQGQGCPKGPGCPCSTGSLSLLRDQLCPRGRDVRGAGPGHGVLTFILCSSGVPELEQHLGVQWDGGEKGNPMDKVHGMRGLGNPMEKVCRIGGLGSFGGSGAAAFCWSIGNCISRPGGLGYRLQHRALGEEIRFD